ncbi:MAG: 23S rRNA (pseudouridine(1915)-N(3))-methyltransferase RlmH [Candidatus Cloacimonetes bacterium]|jgi:23S rRNA (pseudouridine1915-N3)-methyltransferase|nr:23S rRNA (pseudouridine(1915)-N(3))-methyltransferase RlmH [Candidatus Cloacimonadota bacterium]
MKIKIICLGKTKQKFIVEGIKEYQKRISKYAKLNWQILPDVKLTGSKTIKIVKDQEAEILEKSFPASSFIIVLDENGKEFSSEEIAKFIDDKSTFGKDLIFVIGGVYGLSKRILKRADLVLSFSRFTFTHQMIRFLLVEQLYRSFTIIKNKKYHY